MASNLLAMASTGAFLSLDEQLAHRESAQWPGHQWQVD